MSWERQIGARWFRLSGKSRKMLIVTGIILFVGLLIFVNIVHGSGIAPTPVVMAMAEESTIDTTVQATGSLEAVNSQVIVADNGGVLADVYVKAGDHVKAGKVLASFDTSSDNYQLDQDMDNLQEQKANLSNLNDTIIEEQISLQQAQATVKRETVIVDVGGDSQENLQNDQANLKIYEAQYQAMEAQAESADAQIQSAQFTVDMDKNKIAQSVFTADRDGTVLVSNYKVGDYVASGYQLMEIGDPTQLQIDALVDESESSGLEPGLTVEFNCPSLPDQDFWAHIDLVSPAAKEQNSKDSSGQSQTASGPAVEITAIPDGSTSGLRPGYTADMTITTAAANNAVIVPYDSIMDEQNQKKIFVVKNGLAVERNVETGVSNDLYIQITSGVNAGDAVIESPPANLKGGDPVVPQQVASQ